MSKLDIRQIFKILLLPGLLFLVFSGNNFPTPLQSPPNNTTAPSKKDSTQVEKWLAKGDHFFLHPREGSLDSAIHYFQKSVDALSVQSPSDTAEWHQYIFAKNKLAAVWVYQDRFTPEVHQFLQDNLSEAKKYLPAKHLQIGNCHKTMGDFFGYQGKYQQSLDHLNSAIEIFRTYGAETNPRLARIYSNIAQLYFYGQGEFEQSLAYFQLGLESIQQRYPATETEWVNMLNAVGLVAQELGYYDEAIEKYKETLRIRKENQLPNLAQSYNQLGSVSNKKGNYEEGINYHLEARKSWLASGRKKASVLSVNSNNLGLTYKLMGDHTTALSYFMEAATYLENAQGISREGTAKTYGNIGSTLLKLQRYEEALDYANRVLEIRNEILQPTHSDNAKTQNLFGAIYAAQNQYDRALIHYQKAQTIYEDKNWWSHPDYAQTLNNVGKTFENLQQFDTALIHFQKAISAIAPDFNEEDLTKNPSLTNETSIKVGLPRFLGNKAGIFTKLYEQEKKEQWLHQAIETYEVAVDAIDLLRKSYLQDEAKLQLIETSYPLFEKAKEQNPKPHTPKKWIVDLVNTFEWILN